MKKKSEGLKGAMQLIDAIHERAGNDDEERVMLAHTLAYALSIMDASQHRSVLEFCEEAEVI